MSVRGYWWVLLSNWGSFVLLTVPYNFIYQKRILICNGLSASMETVLYCSSFVLSCNISYCLTLELNFEPTLHFGHQKKKKKNPHANKMCPILETACAGACQTPLSIAFSRQEYWSSVAISQSRDRTQVSCTAGRFFYQLSYQGRSWYISGSFLYTVGFSFLMFF